MSSAYKDVRVNVLFGDSEWRLNQTKRDKYFLLLTHEGWQFSFVRLLTCIACSACLPSDLRTDTNSLDRRVKAAVLTNQHPRERPEPTSRTRRAAFKVAPVLGCAPDNGIVPALPFDA